MTTHTIYNTRIFIALCSRRCDYDLILLGPSGGLVCRCDDLELKSSIVVVIFILRQWLLIFLHNKSSTSFIITFKNRVGGPHFRPLSCDVYIQCMALFLSKVVTLPLHAESKELNLNLTNVYKNGWVYGSVDVTNNIKSHSFPSQ